MSGDYDYTLSGEAVRMLLGAATKKRRKAEAILESLAKDPFMAPDFVEVAPSGRRFGVNVFGDVIVTSWVDHGAKEIRIVAIEFV